MRRMQRAWDKYSEDAQLEKAATILLKLTEVRKRAGCLGPLSSAQINVKMSVFTTTGFAGQI